MDTCDLLCLDLPNAERLRTSRMPGDEASSRAARARCLADPTRLTIAAALGEGGELCVCDLSWIAERSQKLVSHHVRALRAQGLARSRREGKMMLYELTPEGARLLGAVLAVPAVLPA